MKRSGDPLTEIGGRHAMPPKPKKDRKLLKQMLYLSVASMIGVGGMGIVKEVEITQIESKNKLLESYVRAAAQEIDLSSVRRYYVQKIGEAFITAGAKMTIPEVVQLALNTANNAKQADIFKPYQKHVVTQDLSSLAAHFRGPQDDFRMVMEAYISYEGEYLGTSEAMDNGVHKLNRLFMRAGQLVADVDRHPVVSVEPMNPISELAMIRNTNVNSSEEGSSQNIIAPHPSTTKRTAVKAYNDSHRQKK